MLTIEPLQHADIAEMVASCIAIGWVKPPSLYERYLSEVAGGTRVVRVGRWDGAFAGYVTVNRESSYPPFRQAGIPEVEDLNVLPDYRRRGIGTALLDEIEAIALERSQTIGLGVGLGREYGQAQRLYVLRGYVPDGHGVESHAISPNWGARVPVDDDLLLHFIKSVVARPAPRK